MKTQITASDVVREGQTRVASLLDQGLSPEELSREIIAWAGDRLGSDLIVMSSMSDELVVHLASSVLEHVNVGFLDTGYHFPETIGTRDAVALGSRVNIINVLPIQSVGEQDATYGQNLYERDPDLCCRLRKVEPLNRVLAGYSGWMSGIRRDEAASRAQTEIVEHDAKRDMVKINPIALWSQADVDRYTRESGIIVNPLAQLGYTSIGCAPCTDRPNDSDPRSGRWAGTTKIECGLHA